jgi:hypothetical protein
MKILQYIKEAVAGKKPVVKDLTFENDDAIFEMANLPKRITGLPADLWIDENGDARSTGHKERRIKFQKQKGESKIPISVTDDPQVLVNTPSSLSGQELTQIKQFIITHKTKIENIMNPSVDYFTADFVIDLKK